MGKFIDLTGMVFGKWTVIERVDTQNGHVRWLCECECGNRHNVKGVHLRSNSSLSCGACSRKVNTWEFKEDCVIGHTQQGDVFYIDLDDFEEVSNYSWYKDNMGYICSTVNGKATKLHRFVMKVLDGEVVDHINHKTYQNTKNNLRICTHQENSMNKKDTKGYCWNKRAKKYRASIQYNGKQIHLGYYINQFEARFAYCEKALELFGEFTHEDVRKDYEKLKENLKIKHN